MRDRKPEETDHFKQVAEFTVAQSPESREVLNTNAKKALELLREDIPTADDDALADVAGNIALIMARLMKMSLADVPVIMERVFTNCALIAAGLVGAYDLGDSTPGPTIEEILKTAAEKLAHAEPEPVYPDSGLKISDEEFEAMVNRQYL